MPTVPALSRFLPAVFALSISALTAVAPACAQPAAAPTGHTAAGVVETILKSKNTSLLQLGGNQVSLVLTIHSRATGAELAGDVTLALNGDDTLPATDALTCAPSLTFGCGVVAKFKHGRSSERPPTVLEARLDDGKFIVGDSRAFETFVSGLIENSSVAIKVRVDQQRDFVFDLRGMPWPLADFAPDHPFARRFSDDPVLAALKRRFPARYLKIVTLARKESAQTGTLPADSERKILDALHATVGTLRPMVSDELLERIVFNASAAAKAVGARDPGLCNALAVAARSAVTTPQLKDTDLAREEYALWQQVVEQASPRFIRKIPNEDLLPSTPRFEDNVRRANESGCGMFAAVIDAILALPRDERRQWLRATVGTTEDLGAPPAGTAGTSRP